MMLCKRFTAVFAAILFGFAALANAGVDTETDSNDVILAGYDAVAYFTQDKAVQGDAAFTAAYNGAVYRFSSAKHRDMFRQDPGKYAPMYGGFCAYGMTFGKKFEIDGKAFEIVDGKLYVNKNLEVKKAWSEDIPKHIREADAQWPKVKDIPADKL